MATKTPIKALDNAVRLYQELPISAKDAAERSGFSKHVLLRELTQRGIARRGRHETRTSYPQKRIYTLNESFFDEIDTEQKAYWLGFIAADGYVDHGSLTINLSEVDRKHLETFCEHVGSNAPIRSMLGKTSFYKGKPIRQGGIAGLYISSTKLIRGLNRQGILQAKSATVEAWDGPSSLIHHYWRGVVDGDGWILKSKNGYYTVGLCGSHAMVDSFALWVKSIVPTTMAVPGPSNSEFIRNFRIAGMAMPQAVLEILYRDATVWLSRKRDIADELLSNLQVPPMQKNRQDIDSAVLREQYEGGLSSVKLAEIYRTSTTTILKKLASSGCQMRTRTEWRKRST